MSNTPKHECSHPADRTYEWDGTVCCKACGQTWSILAFEAEMAAKEAAAMAAMPIHCDIEIWTRSKCGLRVRAGGRLELNAFLELPLAVRGEAVTSLLQNAALEIAKKVTEMDRKYNEARRQQGASEV